MYRDVLEFESNRLQRSGPAEDKRSREDGKSEDNSGKVTVIDE